MSQIEAYAATQLPQPRVKILATKPDPTTEPVNRRSFFKELGIGLLVLPAAGVSVAAIHKARTYLTVLEPEQRDTLKRASEANITWRVQSEPGALIAKWIGSFGRGRDFITVELAAQPHHKGEKRKVAVIGREVYFSYECPSWRHHEDDKKIVEGLFAQARNPQPRL